MFGKNRPYVCLKLRNKRQISCVFELTGIHFNDSLSVTAICFYIKKHGEEGIVHYFWKKSNALCSLSNNKLDDTEKVITCQL